MTTSINLLVLLGQAGEASGNDDLNRGLQIMATGMAVVFSALILIWVLLQVVNRAGAEKKETPVEKPKPQDKAKSVPTPPKAPDIQEGIEPETLAVITATVAAVVGRRPFRLKQVRMTSQTPSNRWAEYGRIQIHQSHRLRKGIR